MLLLAVTCYSWLILGVNAIANVIGVTLVLVWFAWDFVDSPAHSVFAHWALASTDFVTLLSLNPLNFPLLSLRSGRPIDLTIMILFLVTGPVNHLIMTVLQCTRGRAPTPVSGQINAPVFPIMPVVDAEGGKDDAEESAEPEIISSMSPVLGAQAEGGEVAVLCGGRWIGSFERPLTIVLAGVGAETAITAVVVTKGVIRFPKISQDSTGEKVEEFLISSVSSWTLAAFVSTLIRVVGLH